MTPVTSVRLVPPGSRRAKDDCPDHPAAVLPIEEVLRLLAARITRIEAELAALGWSPAEAGDAVGG